MWLLGEARKDSHQGPCAESFSHTTHRCHLSWVEHSLSFRISIGECTSPTLQTPRGPTLLSSQVVEEPVASGQTGPMVQTFLEGSQGGPGRLQVAEMKRERLNCVDLGKGPFFPRLSDQHYYSCTEPSLQMSKSFSLMSSAVLLQMIP